MYKIHCYVTVYFKIYQNVNSFLIKSNQIRSKNTFVKRRMSQANQRRIVAETRQSVHVHYSSVLKVRLKVLIEKLSGSTFIRQ